MPNPNSGRQGRIRRNEPDRRAARLRVLSREPLGARNGLPELEFQGTCARRVAGVQPQRELGPEELVPEYKLFVRFLFSGDWIFQRSTSKFQAQIYFTIFAAQVYFPDAQYSSTSNAESYSQLLGAKAAAVTQGTPAGRWCLGMAPPKPDSAQLQHPRRLLMADLETHLMHYALGPNCTLVLMGDT